MMVMMTMTVDDEDCNHKGYLLFYEISNVLVFKCTCLICFIPQSLTAGLLGFTANKLSIKEIVIKIPLSGWQFFADICYLFFILF